MNLENNAAPDAANVGGPKLNLPDLDDTPDPPLASSAEALHILRRIGAALDEALRQLRGAA
jgi:hypothetical protein